MPIVGKSDPADAGGRATPDLVFEAGAAARLQLPIPADPKRQDRLQETEGLLRRGAGGIRAEMACAVLFRTAYELKAGEGFGGIDPDVVVGFVVPEIDVVARPVLLDQVVLKDQRLLFRPGENEIEIPDSGNEEGDHRPRVGAGEIGPDPRLQVPRLPHVENLPGAVPHQIDAGAPRGMPDLRFQIAGHRLLNRQFLVFAPIFFCSASPREPKELGALPTYC